MQWGTAYLSCVMVVLGKVLHAVGAASIGQTKPAHGVIKLLLTRCVKHMQKNYHKERELEEIKR